MESLAAHELTHLANNLAWAVQHGCSARWIEAGIDQLAETWLQAGSAPWT